MNAAGRLLDDAAEPVPAARVREHLASRLRLPRSVTDIFVFVHGWRTPHRTAQSSFARFFGAVWNGRERWASLPGAAGPFVPWFIGVQWPSSSAPTPGGYQRIRERAHAVSTGGHAAFVLGQLLGYLDEQRDRPRRGADRLTNAAGQYVHCVGHSFGGRFLGEAIRRAADRPAGTLGWDHRSRHPFGVDTYLAFQMAAPPDIFDGRLAGILTDGVVHGRIVLTYSRLDHANAIWHRAMERRPGIGAVGATAPAGLVSTIPLHRPGDPYHRADFATPIVNVDASPVFTRPRLSVTGAHSDYWHAHSIHLLLSLAALARPTGG
ncbi:hypothetical protein ACWT_3019 [Actinoplanes sp. SE50]|uniref:hypothetical protein n=1 Tax=unclassified Actinoplanes TaxID=2626549 RepID=UPI00023EBF06|nr:MULTISPECIES: hypothetical protein [unclassified Actinoplanes]AEV84041.1 hypothetical protein ACPL_3146 [Actinoplanes sp. SE50/110]ATO82434.1 hypothetical protein ACWT_3019 [Actinoplanes sp. SE50]SLL99841.1 hypothetical protein ACSP50_3073 [Actinoplanes sp. SE50/110]